MRYVLKHVLHFLKPEQAENAGKYIYETMDSQVAVYQDKVVFTTTEWLVYMTQVVILNHTRPYGTDFNRRKVEV